jgi:hypothetical protein
MGYLLNVENMQISQRSIQESLVVENWPSWALRHTPAIYFREMLTNYVTYF